MAGHRSIDAEQRRVLIELGAATLAATGIGMFLDGIFRLDCQSIDAGCINDSWHSHAHKIESDFTVGVTFISILLLALAFRRILRWHDSWLPTIAAIPVVFVANLAFSPIGPGAATRAGTVVVLAVVAFIGFELLQHALRPELVPSVEVEEVLAPVHDPTVFELEHDAAVDV